MRVLKISHSAGVDEWRGRERGLVARGVEVHTLCAAEWPEGGATVVAVPRPGERLTGVRTVGRHPALFVYDPRPLWRALRRHPDIVDIHEEPFALATAEVLVLRWLSACRSPFTLYTAQNLDKRYPLPFRWLERAALRRAAGISACNTDAARIAERKGFPGRARVIPLGVDLARFAPSAARRPRPDDPVIVGFVGRLVAEKGIFVLLDALEGDNRLHARIAGGGPLAGRLAAEVAARGITDRVQLVGAVDPDEIEDFYRSVDVVAIPSIPRPGWTEQFGRVAIEAMASGIPVVSSDAGALPDVVADAGIVVLQGDAAALADGLVRAAGEQAATLRERGFARAAECSWDAVAEDYLDLYGSVLHQAAAEPASEPAVEVIVVAYGAPDLLRAALEPVASALPVTVVDNSSSLEIAALCAELGVRYLDAGRNGGFGAGVNVGLANRLLPGADVLLLNPDARIEPAGVTALHHALRADPGLASVAPAQTDGAGRGARVEWPFPSPGNAWLEAVGFGRLQRGGTYVIGSVLMLRAEALAQIGGFDERFFLYAEETDWAFRAHRLGWRHALVTGVLALHEGAATSTDSRVREAHFAAGLERYLSKHYGAGGWQAARAAMWFGAAARSVALRGERGAAACQRAALFRLGPVRVEGRIMRQAPRP